MFREALAQMAFVWLAVGLCFEGSCLFFLEDHG